MSPVPNDQSSGACPTPGAGGSPPTGATGPLPGPSASAGSDPSVTVVSSDIPGARPVGTAGSTATSTTGTTTATMPPGAGVGIGLGVGAAGAPPADPCVPDPNYKPKSATSAAPEAAPRCVPDPDYKPNPAKEAFGKLKGDFDELKEYASLYLGAKVDGFKVTLRNLGLYAALGVIGAIAGAAMLATAAGLIVVGIAHGLGVLFGGRMWLGDLVTGILILAAVGAGAYFMMNKLTGTWRSQTLKKYEQRKQTQRERFGHDVSGRAREAAAAARQQAASAGRSGR